MVIEYLKSKVEVTIKRIDRWMNGKLLHMVPEKTEVIIFHRGYSRVYRVSFKHVKVEKAPSRATKYSIWLDDNIIFAKHAKKQVRKSK